MATLVLPPEILRHILSFLRTPYLFGDIRSRFHHGTIPTSLLLVNKFICTIAMEEQMRYISFDYDRHTFEEPDEEVDLVGKSDEEKRRLLILGITSNSKSSRQLRKWLETIEDRHMLSIPRYRDMLGFIKHIELRCGSGGESERIASFIQGCSNLQSLHLDLTTGNRQRFPRSNNNFDDVTYTLIFQCLPARLEFLYIECENDDKKKISATFNVFVQTCLPRLRDLHTLTWCSRRCNSIQVGDVFSLFGAIPPFLRYLHLEIQLGHFGAYFDDSAMNVVLEQCPQLHNFRFGSVPHVSNGKIFEWLQHHGKTTTDLELNTRSFTDQELSSIGVQCPRLKRLNLAYSKGFTPAGVRSLLNQCPQLDYLWLPLESGFTDDPLWERIPKLFWPPFFQWAQQDPRKFVILDREEINHFRVFLNADPKIFL